MSEADGGVRRLVLVHGKEAARAMVEPEQKALVDIAAEIMGDEDGRIGITYTGFCLTALPHKRLPDEHSWEKRGYRVTLLVETGRKGAGNPPKYIGVPYGARARMILLYLFTCRRRRSAPATARSSSAGPCATGCSAWGCPGAAKPVRRCASRPPASRPATFASPGRATLRTAG